MKTNLCRRSFANRAFGLVLALLVCAGLAAAGERSLPQKQPMHKTAVKDTTVAATPKPIIDDTPINPKNTKGDGARMHDSLPTAKKRHQAKQ
jgi:hypothetical protein